MLKKYLLAADIGRFTEINRRQYRKHIELQWPVGNNMQPEKSVLAVRLTFAVLRRDTVLAQRLN
ncbi:hypothetical protein GCM10011338_20290 [Alteromonas lipolytica]|uniref:Uncharacterized protein n=1 Tax=Alteromonas lipolytica TaxID=1856405 RepID=A0A1E8FD43_9ALTE|nr:hypothetical protein BFC17_19870 [Alteromonas lipolytica]GGF68031.1 hypothetical protein GCM10011338_20290 [Alteromonas lipolytica]